MLEYIFGSTVLSQNYQSGDLIYSEDQVNFENFQSQFEQRGYPCAWIGDVHPTCPLNGVNYYYLPAWLHVWVNSNYKSYPPPIDVSNLVTDKCFNFLIRDPRMGRYLTVKLVEMFELTSMFYTLSDDIKNIKTKQYLDTLRPSNDIDYNEFLQYTKSNVDVKLEKVFYQDQKPPDQFGRYDHTDIWNKNLKPNCEKTAVSLITETSDDCNLQQFSEKTLNAMDAMTFPIWVGGYRTPTEWQSYGFDIFEDIIDHSYQHYETLSERCYYAVKNNLELLTNLDLAQQLRQTHFSRLLKNRNNVKRNIQRVYQTQWKKIPQEYREQIRFLVQKSANLYGSGLTNLSMLAPDLPGGNSNWYNYNSSQILLTIDQPNLANIEEKFAQSGPPQAWISGGWPDCPLKNVDQYYYLPIFLRLIAEKFHANAELAPWTDSAEYCFNFMINRTRVNRYLLLKLIHWFGFKSYNYTSSLKGQPLTLAAICNSFDSPLIEETNRDQFKSYILDTTTVEIADRFFPDPELPHDVYGRMDQLANWELLLKPIFLSSATSLITESCDDVNLSMLTEKTIYAMIGLTFPIWVGGYKLPAYWKQFGFDIFEDIIDHSYQHSECLLERCYLALKLNQRLLTNLDYANSCRQQMKQRLISNQINMHKFIQNYYKQQWDKIPTHIQNVICGQCETMYTVRCDT